MFENIRVSTYDPKWRRERVSVGKGEGRTPFLDGDLRRKEIPSRSMTRTITSTEK